MPSRKPLPQQLPKICIALGLPTIEKLLQHARAEIESGERFLEFRLDYLADPAAGSKAIREFLVENPDVSILATCRRHQNHGRFNGSIDEQIRILEEAVRAGACAVDVEIESAENATGKLDHLRAESTLILSYHNYEGTPPPESILKRMMKVPAHAYKVVTTAKKPNDSQKLLSLAKSFPREKLILLAMGETGFPTRVLSPAWGGIYTYAAPNAAEGTASGQVSARLLRNLYRIEKFTKNAKIFGVVADPVRHSISPNVHNRAFQARRLDAVYLPLLVQPAQMKDFFAFADSLPLAGLQHYDSAQAEDHSLSGCRGSAGEADWGGEHDLEEGREVAGDKYGRGRGDGAAGKRVKLNKSSILIAGNGGAARGAAFALADAGAKISLVGRNLDRVRALARICGGEPLSREQAVQKHFDVVVHATPIGMWPNVKDCFFDDKIPGDIVFDMVYNPLETLLLKKAKDQGREVIDGLQMFLEQASQQFEIFTGESAPRSVMEKAALEALGAKSA
jgi:3-dehydroquinate dehydratase / shikimate dehydrogenase